MAEQFKQANAIELATKFTCQVLASLHKLNLDGHIYPCRDLAYELTLRKNINKTTKKKIFLK